MYRRSKVCGVVLLALAGIAAAQTAVPRLLRQNAGHFGVSFEYWSSGDDKISEWVLPLMIRYAASDRLNITLINQPTVAKLQRPAKDYSLSGLTDTRLGLSYLFGGEQFLATAGLNLPTGQTALNAEELSVAQVIPLHALGLRTTYFGGGLDLSAGLSAALPFGDWVLAAGVGVVYKGNFKPVAGSGEYAPGEELSLTVGMDRSFGEESKFLADATYTLYTTDTFEKTDYFKAGPRLLLEARYYLPWQSLKMCVIVRDRIKGKNQVLQEDPKTSLFKLREEAANSHGNELDLIAQGTYSMSERTNIDALLQAKTYSTNELDANGATIFGIGGGWRRELSSHLRLDAGATFYFGSLKDQGKSNSITGLELRGGLIYQF